MGLVNFLVAISVLFVSTSFFCLLMTTDFGWGPIAYVASFFGGIIFIGWAGVVCLDFFKD